MIALTTLVEIKTELVISPVELASIGRIEQQDVLGRSTRSIKAF
jgi:hypothetical protein